MVTVPVIILFRRSGPRQTVFFCTTVNGFELRHRSGSCPLFPVQGIVFQGEDQRVSVQNGPVGSVFIGEIGGLIVPVLCFEMPVIKSEFGIVKDRKLDPCTDIRFILNQKRRFFVVEESGEAFEVIPGFA